MCEMLVCSVKQSGTFFRKLNHKTPAVSHNLVTVYDKQWILGT